MGEISSFCGTIDSSRIGRKLTQKAVFADFLQEWPFKFRNMEYVLDLTAECEAIGRASERASVECPPLPLEILAGQPCVNPDELKEGHSLLIMSDDFSESLIRAKVTHVYKHWVFWEILEGKHEGEEHVINTKSQFYREFVFPSRILITNAMVNKVRLPSDKIIIEIKRR